MFDYFKMNRPNTIIKSKSKEQTVKLDQFMRENNLSFIIPCYDYKSKEVIFKVRPDRRLLIRGDSLSYDDVPLNKFNFKENDKVSIICYAEDRPVVKGKITKINSDVMTIVITDAYSIENGEEGDFNLDGSLGPDKYRLVYHGWDVKLEIENEKIPERKKWVTCTPENVKVESIVRSKKYPHSIFKVIYILEEDAFVLMSHKGVFKYNMSSFEVEMDC